MKQKSPRPKLTFTPAAVREATEPAGTRFVGARYRNRNARLDITLNADHACIRLDFKRLLTTANERRYHAAAPATRLRYVRRGILYTHVVLRPDALAAICHFAEMLGCSHPLGISCIPLHAPA